MYAYFVLLLNKYTGCVGGVASNVATYTVTAVNYFEYW